MRLSNSYRQRLYYITFYEEASKYFSRNFFKKYELNKILEMAEDKVANIRITISKIFIKIRWMVDDDDEESEDVLKEMSHTLKKLTLDTDTDVRKVLLEDFLSVSNPTIT